MAYLCLMVSGIVDIEEPAWGNEIHREDSLKGGGLRFTFSSGSLVWSISPLMEATCNSTPTNSIMTHESFRFVGLMATFI